MVLNDAPDLPLIFMLLQCLSTVGLLTLTSKLTDKVQVPQIEMRTAKQLAPLFLIDVVGFVFNTLCLRDVEATFFQVSQCESAIDHHTFTAPHYPSFLILLRSLAVSSSPLLSSFPPSTSGGVRPPWSSSLHPLSPSVSSSVSRRLIWAPCPDPWDSSTASSRHSPSQCTPWSSRAVSPSWAAVSPSSPTGPTSARPLLSVPSSWSTERP
jgi:hypothetical protein